MIWVRPTLGPNIILTCTRLMLVLLEARLCPLKLGLLRPQSCGDMQNNAVTIPVCRPQLLACLLNSDSTMRVLTYLGAPEISPLASHTPPKRPWSLLRPIQEGYLYDCIELFRGSGNWSLAHEQQGLTIHAGLDSCAGRGLRADITSPSVARELIGMAARRIGTLGFLVLVLVLLGDPGLGLGFTLQGLIQQRHSPPNTIPLLASPRVS